MTFSSDISGFQGCHLRRNHPRVATGKKLNTKTKRARPGGNPNLALTLIQCKLNKRLTNVN
jgi:hypothetical protein